MISDALRLQPKQKHLTPEQEAAARQFAQDRIAAYLLTSPVDKAESEEWLRRVYARLNLPPPKQVVWLDDPIQLGMQPELQRAAPQLARISLMDRIESTFGSWGDMWSPMRNKDLRRFSTTLHVSDRIYNDIVTLVYAPLREQVMMRVGTVIERSIREVVGQRMPNGHESVSNSAIAYTYAPMLAAYSFFDTYLAPNDRHDFACFNEMVSGYWLGRDTAYLVRKPYILAFNDAGHLHSAIGKCVKYTSGWGFYAWHGVRVPEKVILHPEQLTRFDFFDARDVEVRRVIQERMGERFVPEMDGTLIDEGPRGKLWEVRLRKTRSASPAMSR